MLVPRERLSFDLTDLIEHTIDEWSQIKASGLVQPPAESCGDFIAAEMSARDLRLADSQNEEALFDGSASDGQFREAIIAALDRWLIATESKPKTPEDIDDYNRPCSE
jgi:hypothetical protein